VANILRDVQGSVSSYLVITVVWPNSQAVLGGEQFPRYSLRGQ